jgi:ADP-ribose pyrophosphatase
MLHDVVQPRRTITRERMFDGVIFDVWREHVDLGDQGVVDREFVDHPGAVGILAMNDDGEIALIQQYRHAVKSMLWEIPAGLLDVTGEPAHCAAARELAEEADLEAATWHTLVDMLNSPGFANETIRIFLARDLTPVAEADRFERTEEEADFEVTWVPLDEAVAAALAGQFHNVSLVTAVLAAKAARDAGWAPLRSPDAPMPYRRVTA